MSLRSKPLSEGLRGAVRPPGDKSISHRAVMFGSIASGQTLVHDWLDAADTRATLNACRALGANITDRKTESGHTELVIEGAGARGLSASEQALDLGNSGTGVRLLMGLLAGMPFRTELTGDHSLSRRPMGRVIKPLQAMGAVIQSQDECLPVVLDGCRLKACHYDSPIASAQVKSAVLLAGLNAEGRTSVAEPALSRDHTERMLQDFGVAVERDGLTVSIEGGAQLTGCEIRVPADISSAAFFMVAASIIPGSDITIQNVGLNQTRRGLLDVLLQMGANIEINMTSTGAEPIADLHVRHASLKGIDVPVELVVSMIDEFPILMVAASLAEGVTRIRGAEELRVKESDRLAVMAKGLQQLGVELEETPDGAVIHGQCGESRIQGGRVDAADDHRCAMSFAVLAACAQAPIEIDGSDYIATSYPRFQQDFMQLGGQLEHVEQEGSGQHQDSNMNAEAS